MNIDSAMLPEYYGHIYLLKFFSLYPLIIIGLSFETAIAGYYDYYRWYTRAAGFDRLAVILYFISSHLFLQFQKLHFFTLFLYFIAQ